MTVLSLSLSQLSSPSLFTYFWSSSTCLFALLISICLYLLKPSLCLYDITLNTLVTIISSFLVLIPLVLLVTILGALLLVSSHFLDILLLVSLPHRYHFDYPYHTCLLLVLITLILLVNIVGALLLIAITLILPRFWCFRKTISDTKDYDKGSTSNILKNRNGRIKLHIIYQNGGLPLNIHQQP